MEALSGLTPALSRRLQKQLLAHLPPAAARTLRRTLSMQNTDSVHKERQKYARSHSASKSMQTDSTDTSRQDDALVTPQQIDKRTSVLTTETAIPQNISILEPIPTKESKQIEKTERTIIKDDHIDIPIPQFSTLPRLKRSNISRETTPIASPADISYDQTGKVGKDTNNSRGSSVRSTPDRPLLSKYLTPDRTFSLDESFSSDSGSILSEPSYIAAYGAPMLGNVGGLGFRRHSMRAVGEQPKKRISRFLRPDFFDTPPEESIYAKHKKEKELETQKILKEIRDKKNKSIDSTPAKSPTETNDVLQTLKDEPGYSRKALSPLGFLTGKERSRSTTPFFPMLDNIKETTLDSATKNVHNELDKNIESQSKIDKSPPKESKLVRPKSYPVKTYDTIDRPQKNSLEHDGGKENEFEQKLIPKESKLVRPKSFPTNSPPPEKTYVNGKAQIDENKISKIINSPGSEIRNDIEVSFSVSLPKKNKAKSAQNTDIQKSNSKTQANEMLILKKYQVVENEEKNTKINEENPDHKTLIGNGGPKTEDMKSCNSSKTKVEVSHSESKKDDARSDMLENEKKKTIKKKIIKKVSSKSKADLTSNQNKVDTKVCTEKKKVTKKIKEKNPEENKTVNVVKKKSVLQSIGHKLEKFTSTKSNSPEKMSENKVLSPDAKKDSSKQNRAQREQSVPVNVDPPTESNLIKRAVTLTDVAALDNSNNVSNKTTVSKVLGLFKKFEPKDKSSKVIKSPSDNTEPNLETNNKNENELDLNEKEKPKRPTSLLLNGLGRKNKYGRSTSDSISVTSMPTDDQDKSNSEKHSKRNSLKLDFSRLPRVNKKIVPTNPVIEPQIVYCSDKDNEKNNIISDAIGISTSGLHGCSKSRSRSTVSNSETTNVEVNPSVKSNNESRTVPLESTHHPYREHEPTTPEREDINERIRRKSLYSRFNEKKHRRKSNLVGPGAIEYDPVARLHPQPIDLNRELSPTSPLSYDLSPGFSGVSDLSPSSERYRTLLSDLPVSPKSALRFENYGLNDKIDAYRSLDRNDFRKYPGRSYLDYDPPSSYGTHRYARTMSMMDSDVAEDNLGHLRDPHKYNRTISMYAPGSYATYRPKRTRNSAIILKESEKEPSPENILDKIRQRKKISISVTRKPDAEELSDRSTVTPKGEGDGPECSQKVD